jgi:hypothetical protein
MKAADIAQTVRTLLNAIRNTYFQKRLSFPYGLIAPRLHAK